MPCVDHRNSNAGRAAWLSIGGLFAQQVARQPDSIAVEDTARQWTY